MCAGFMGGTQAFGHKSFPERSRKKDQFHPLRSLSVGQADRVKIELLYWFEKSWKVRFLYFSTCLFFLFF